MMSMRRAGHAVVAAAAIAVVGIGCGSDDDASSQTTSSAATSTAAARKPANIAYLSYAYNDYVQAEEQGVKEAVEPGGGSVKMFNANFDPSKLQADCNDAISSGRYNAIVLAPVTSPTGVPCATAAKAAGIPVVAMEFAVGKDPNDIQPQVPGVVGGVVYSPEAAGKGIAVLVKEACAGLDPCKVIAEETPGEQYTTAANAEVTKLPGVEIVQKYDSKFDPSVVAKVIPDVLRRNSDANVLLTTSDSDALAALPAIEDAGMTDQLKVIGAGGSRLGAKAVQDGQLYGTVGSWPVQYGKRAGEIAIKAVNREPLPQPPGIAALTIDGPASVTSETVDRFKPEWGASR